MTTAERTETALGHEYNDLSERQVALVRRAAAHADDFATRAAEHDREGSYVAENIEKLHDSGYMKQCLPSSVTGEDATIEDLCLTQERLAYGCGSTALCANMHSFFCGAIAEMAAKGDQRFQMPMMGIAHARLTLGGAISEVESSDPFRHPAARVERVDGGFKLNGRKVFGSNTPSNPFVAFSGLLEEDGETKVLTFQLPKETAGVTIIPDWDVMGMRGTASYTVEFKDCVAPEAFKMFEIAQDTPIEDQGFPFLFWFAPTIAATYTGIAAAARDYARNAVATRSRLPHGELRHTPGVQYSVAEMFIGVESARAFVRRSAQRLGDPTWRNPDALALAEATQQFATQSAVKVVDTAVELMGGGAFHKRSPLERMYRDVRAGKFHPIPHWDALETIGKAELGISELQSPRFL